MAMRNLSLFSNPTLLLALRMLAHPLSLGALALLLANDTLFRRLWPSWWTGKIGDAAWLMFAPWLLACGLSVLKAAADGLRAAFFAWAAPTRTQRQTAQVPIRAQTSGTADVRLLYLSLAVTGLGFGLVKTVPALHLLATRTAANILGSAPSLIRDPSDLLALPMLLIPLALLNRTLALPATVRQDHASWRPPLRPLLRWAALPLAALVLLADAAAPDFGFQCFEELDGRIYANAGYQAYVSADGGRTWEYHQPGAALCDPQPALAADTWHTADGPNGVDYRYRPGEEIQVSTDGGQSWQTGMRLAGIGEPEQYYILKTREGNPVYQPGPLDAIADPVTGSMIFAMGQQGVLVHVGGGEWVWSFGGAYQRVQNFPDGTAFVVLRGPMIYMALALALLIYATLALGWTGGWLRAVVLVTGWLAWVTVGIIFPPPSSYGYGEVFTLFGVTAAGVLAIPLVVEQTFKLTKLNARGAPVNILKMAAVALGGGLLYFVPFLLWLYGALPSLNIATIAALVIAFAALGAGITITRRAGPQPL